MAKEGKIRNATPTTEHGIKFRSKLELYCYNKLVEAGLTFDYEKESFVIMDKFEFPNKSVEVVKRKGKALFTDANSLIRNISYTPDFTNLNDRWIIECKGFPNMAFPIRWKLFKKYLTDNNLNYDLYMPRNRKQVDETINLILNKNESV